MGTDVRIAGTGHVRRRVRRGGVPALWLLVATAGMAGAAAQDALTLDEVLFRANEAIIAYEKAFAGAIADERYMQRILDARGRVRRARELESSYVFYRTPASETWVGLRDVNIVDGRTVDPAKTPLSDLARAADARAFFAEATRRYIDSGRHSIGLGPRTLNVPTLALTFLHPLNQHRSGFEKEGEETIDGVAVWKVRFSEQARPALIRAGRTEVFARGAFWIEPGTGRVFRSEITIGDANSRQRSQFIVTYGHDPALGTLVPLEMREGFEDMRSPRADRIEGVATYSNYRRLAFGPDASASTAARTGRDD